MVSDVDREGLESAVGRLMSQPPELGLTRALVAVHGGEVAVEEYGPDTTPRTPLISWSTAKSITHALVGMCVLDGLLDVNDPAQVPEWRSPGDSRQAITLQHLLEMRDGLDFNEEYVDIGASHVVDMLFGAGQDDVAGFAARRPALHPPGTVWNYSSGSTNIVARLVGDAVGGREAMEGFIQRRLFDPLGMTSATARFDEAGTFIGSSFVYASATDYARFGSLYLSDGVWGGQRLVPEGWVDHARTCIAHDETSGFGYGAHWWLWPDQPASLGAHGYEGQYIVVLPARDLVLVRLGVSPAELRPALVAQLRTLIAAFPAVLREPG